MIKRVIMSILVGVITALIVFVIGALISVIPVIAPVGEVLKWLAPVFGLVAGIWYFLSGRTLVD